MHSVQVTPAGTSVTTYLPVPGVTPQQLADNLRAQGKTSVRIVQPAASGSVSPMAASDCSYSATVRNELTSAGCTAIYCDEQVPIRADWSHLDRALAAVPAGGTLIVCRLIHVDRSLEHLADLLVDLDHRGVRLHALHEQLDTAEHGELLRQVTQGLIDARKSGRSQATREGIAEAIAAGRKPGRRPGPPPLNQEQDELAHQLKTTGLPIAEIADLIGVSRAKPYRARRPDQPPTIGEESAP